MQLPLPVLRPNEETSLRLRGLYESMGYGLYRMGSFEAYDLYLKNKPFLEGEDILTFTSADGRLLALKPDVTLSIVQNTPAGEIRKVYYQESVFRRSRSTGDYREIEQMGLEYIGGDMSLAQAEVLALAGTTLSAVGGGFLDLSHMGFIEAMLLPLCREQDKKMALRALRAGNAGELERLAGEAGLAADDAQRLAELALLSGPYNAAMRRARLLSRGMSGAQRVLDEMEELVETLPSLSNVELRLDFSILNDIEYYNGLIFQGYLPGVPVCALSGGRYDNLLSRLAKPQGAVGFALYLDEIEKKRTEGWEETEETEMLNIALPKGRMARQIGRLLTAAGFNGDVLEDEGRKLVLEDESNRMRYMLVKPSDVGSYVEHGAADIGVTGKDVLLENGTDVLELLDLGLGQCRLSIAAQKGFVEDMTRPLRVATKYPQMARRYYASRSREVEIIPLHGSIELAPLLGLSDVIMDIVETGSTLRENNLEVIAEVAPSSARLIANRASWRFKDTKIRALAERLGEVL